MDTPVIDFHNHASRWTKAGMIDDPDRFLRIMDSSGIDRACINCIYYGDARRANDIVARYCEQNPDRFIPIAFVTPHYPKEAIAELERCFDELGTKFLKIYPAYAMNPIDHEVYAPIFKWANERKIVVMSHATFTTGLTEREGYAKLAERFPDVKWVWAHGGGGWTWRIEGAIEVARGGANVYFETANDNTEFGEFERLVNGVGADRVVFGSDMPLFDARQEVARIVTADIPAESKQMILGLNAVKLLGLDD